MKILSTIVLGIALSVSAAAGPNSPCFLKKNSSECFRPVEFLSGGTYGFGQKLNAPLVSSGGSEVAWNRADSFATSGINYTPILWSTGAGGLQVSLDDANNWTTVTTSFATRIENVYQEGPMVLAGYFGASVGGVAISRNYGATFTTFAGGAANVPSGTSLRIDPINGRYFVTGNTISYSDNLSTFTATTGLTRTVSFTSIVDDQNGNLFVSDLGVQGYRSTDNGATWSTFATSGFSPRYFYAYQSKLYACSSSGLRVTSDLTNWRLIDATQCERVVVVGKRIYTARDNEVLRVSIDGGITWVTKDFGASGDFDTFSVQGTRIYADGDNMSLQYSDDNGSTWTNVASQPSTSNFYLLVQGGTNEFIPFTGVSRNWGFRVQRLEADGANFCSTTTANIAGPLRLGRGVWSMVAHVSHNVAGTNINIQGGVTKTSATLPPFTSYGVPNDDGEMLVRDTLVDGLTSLSTMAYNIMLPATSTALYLIGRASTTTNCNGYIQAVQH